MGAFGTNLEIVLDDDGLAVEQKTLIGARRIVEELIDERDQSLSKALQRVVPLAVPMGVCNDMNVESHRRGMRRG
jgi:hypothetical protein